MMNNTPQNVVGDWNIITETKNELTKNECESITKEKKWKRNCPKCNNILIYYSRQNLWRANKNKCLCKICGLSGNNFAKNYKHTDITKEKIKMAGLGRKHTKEVRLKISNSKKGKPSTLILTEIMREKMRLSRWKQIENMGGGPTYNPKACKYIDKLNKKFGWSLQHAMNGGEIKISGYSVDGYDKEKNIVFEYDEPNHNEPKRKNRDIIRQERIIRKLKPSLFVRYDEEYDRLYNDESSQDIEVLVD